VGIEKAIAALALGAALAQGAYAQEPKPTDVFAVPKGAYRFTDLPHKKGVDFLSLGYDANLKLPKTIQLVKDFLKYHRVRVRDPFMSRDGVSINFKTHYDFNVYKQWTPRQSLRPKNFEPLRNWRKDTRIQVGFDYRF
jgi:hypothetical protein